MTELYDTTYPPKAAIIDGLLYAGTYLFVGAPKIGKSFFMAQLSYHVATGTSLWQYDVHPDMYPNTGHPVLGVFLCDTVMNTRR